MALTEIPIELSSTPGIVDNSNATAITIDASENVGIGTVPIYDLDILDTSETILGIRASDSSGTNVAVRFQDAGTGTGVNGLYVGRASALNYFWTYEAEPLLFGTSATERLRITSAGALQLSDVNSPNDINTAIFSKSDVLEFEAFGTNGAIAFTTGSGVDERLRIDSAGSTIIKSGNKLILNRTDNLTGGEISYVAGTGFIFNDANGDGVSFNQGVVNKVRIDSAGNVGIGTSSVSAPLHIKSSTGNAIFLQENGSPTTGTGQVGRFVSTTSNVTDALDSNGYYRIGGSTNPVTGAGFSEYMRIDASGRLLIGKTVADSIGTDGIELDGANDRVLITRSDNEPLVLNRKTSDGDIAVFRKDGSAVGSIGTAAGFPYFAAPANFSLMLATTDFRPRTVTGASDNDSAVDLGTSGSRFKDLYIGGDIGHKDASGNARLLYDKSVNLLGNAGTNVEAYNVTASNGIYLGGTAAANLLDDYEEGTWTPTLVGNTSGSATITVSSANYTKVGNKVFAACYIGTIDLSNDTIVGSMRIGGLPFSGASRYTQAVSIMYQTISTAYPNLSGYVQTNQIEINQNTTTTTLARSDCVSTSSRAIMIGVTYITSL